MRDLLELRVRDRRGLMVYANERSNKYNYTHDCPCCGREYHDDAVGAVEDCVAEGHYDGHISAYAYVGGISYGDRVVVIPVSEDTTVAGIDFSWGSAGVVLIGSLLSMLFVLLTE